MVSFEMLRVQFSQYNLIVNAAKYTETTLNFPKH